MKHSFILLIYFLLVLLAVLLAAAWYFYRVGVQRRKKDFIQNNPDIPRESVDETWGAGKVWLAAQSQTKLHIVSKDGLTLKAIYLTAQGPSENTVILVHGYAGRGQSMAFLAQYYCEKLGFNVLMPDLRGHGESQGNYIGFGWHDRLDLLQWIQRIIDLNQGAGKIILHGISMGGATVLMTSGERLPDNVVGIISDCAYTSAQDILTHQLKKMYRLPAIPLLPITSLICKLRAGYFFKEASAVRQVAKTNLPILFIHGTDDKFVPTWMVHELFGAVKTEQKRKFLVEDAGHGNAYWKDTQGYQRHIQDFVEALLTP